MNISTGEKRPNSRSGGAKEARTGSGSKTEVFHSTNPTPTTMRVTRVLRILLALQDTYVTGFEFTEDGLVIDVRPTWRIGRCGDCQRKAPSNGKSTGNKQKWRHLDLAGIKCWIRYRMRRVSCPKCGVKVEHVPWAESNTRFTKAFEMHTAYLAQKNDKTAVTKQMRIAWATVGKIVTRVVRRLQGAVDRLDGLRLIGVDELSYRRHHQYVTVVVDHERGEVVWAAEGKSAATLKQFFGAPGKAWRVQRVKFPPRQAASHRTGNRVLRAWR